MKINGHNQTQFNPYKNQAQKLEKMKSDIQKQDRLEISNQAKHLQQTNQVSEKREKYVQNIKDEVQSGEYKFNYEKTAQKMINFWKGK